MKYFDMRLKEQPFTKIKEKKKTIELRLYDDKRRQLDIGDYIIFTNLGNETEQIAVKVKGLFRADSFLNLFEDISLEKCGNVPDITKEKLAQKMRAYYSKEDEIKQGVLGIKIELADLEEVLMKREQGYQNMLDHLLSWVEQIKNQVFVNEKIL